MLLPVIPAESIGVISLSWQPEGLDYSEAFQARNRKRGVGWLSWAMVGVGVVFAVLAVFGGEPGYAVIGVAIALFFLLMRRFGSSALFNKYPDLRQPVQMTVDPRTGITGEITVVTMEPGAMKVNRGSWQFPWDQIEYILDAKRTWAVHLTGQNGKTFFLVARRGTTDPQQQAALHQLLTR